MKNSLDAYSKLQVLNTFLAATSGTESEMFDQLNSAILFAATQRNTQLPHIAPEELLKSSEHLVELHQIDNPEIAFAYCDLANLPCPSQLWVRESLLNALKKISGCNRCVIIIRGLRKLVSQDEIDLNKKNKKLYNDLLQYSMEFIASRVSPQTHINILFY